MTGLPPADPTTADTGATPPSRTRRRWKLGAISASAILVAAAGTVALIQHAEARPTLKSAGGGLDICYRATSEADVQALAHAGLSFGVDPVELTSDGGHATVTSVTMIEPTGGVVLDRSLFLPAGGVGIGTPGDKGIDVSPPQLASMARALPAALSRTTQPPDLPPPYDTDYRDKVWQLA
ncbi:MAG: hypothetical protein JWO63_484, partial [Frankiales bacterium]|nr:hypothetical protein [Frankiales bacterium]